MTRRSTKARSPRSVADAYRSARGTSPAAAATTSRSARARASGTGGPRCRLTSSAGRGTAHGMGRERERRAHARGRITPRQHRAHVVGVAPKGGGRARGPPRLQCHGASPDAPRTSTPGGRATHTAGRTRWWKPPPPPPRDRPRTRGELQGGRSASPRRGRSRGRTSAALANWRAIRWRRRPCARRRVERGAPRVRTGEAVLLTASMTMPWLARSAVRRPSAAPRHCTASVTMYSSARRRGEACSATGRLT